MVCSWCRDLENPFLAAGLVSQTADAGEVDEGPGPLNLHASDCESGPPGLSSAADSGNGRTGVLPAPSHGPASPHPEPLNDPLPPGLAAAAPADVGRSAWRRSALAVTPLTYVLTSKACRSRQATEVPTMMHVVDLLNDIEAEVQRGCYVDAKGRVQVC